MKLFHKPPEFSIGIDFGTTTTRLCYLDNRVSYQVAPRVEPIRSIVAPRQTKDKKWIWFSGESVLEKGLDHYSCFKWKMGCMEEITLEPSVQGGEPIKMRPEILAAHIIWVIYTKVCEDRRDLRNCKNVTITIPAEWNAIQRQATILAGRIAGFSNVHLIEEPVAAFLAINEFHPDDRLKQAENTLVFDCGGGTLDITVIHRPDRSKSHAFGRQTEAAAVRGDPGSAARLSKWHVFGRRTEALPFVSGRDTNAGELAGEAIDQKLAAEVIGESNWKQMSPIDQRYLANIIRQLKESLNPKDRSKDPLHEASQSKVVILPDSKREFEPGTIRLTIGQLNKVAEEIAERAREIIQGALKSAGIHSSDIEAVVMVGGSSYLRPLQKVIATEFPKLEWGRGLYLEQPEEIVAIGAAMYQADLDHGRQRFGLRMPMETFLDYE
ncbi:MAG: Hsp70 family protein [Candidatus Hadarchaeum sp.]